MAPTAGAVLAGCLVPQLVQLYRTRRQAQAAAQLRLGGQLRLSRRSGMRRTHMPQCLHIVASHAPAPSHWRPLPSAPRHSARDISLFFLCLFATGLALSFVYLYYEVRAVAAVHSHSRPNTHHITRCSVQRQDSQDFADGDWETSGMN